MKNLYSLFLSQAYQDCWDDYMRSLKMKNFPKWDYVILTASNEQQAENFRKQLKEREDFLPRQTRFAVISDPDGKRVGSGGATLEVLKYLHAKDETFEKLCVLVIHSGGDSKRVPQYSAIGKLFSPVPHKLPNGRNAALFDELMIGMSSVPSRIGNGMMLLSGDVLLLFNPLQIDYNNVGAAAISFKESVETGKNHGVYVMGTNGNVKHCLQKKPVEVLRKEGAVNEMDCVDIDTGALIFSTEMMDSLYTLIETEEEYHKFVNEKTRLSLYADFLYPLAEASTLDAFYREKPEGTFCPELMEVRKRVWEVLRPYRMKLLRFSPARFLHFGTTKEILNLMQCGITEYYSLGWANQTGSSMKQEAAGYNSILSAQATVGEACYLEASCVSGRAKLGNHSVLSYLTIQDERIPAHVVMHGLKLLDGKFVVRIFGVEDNPKENKIFGMDLDILETKLQVKLWKNTEHSLWNAELYPVGDTIKEATAGALNLYAVLQGKGGDLAAWKNASKSSLCSGFAEADPDAIIAWSRRMEDLVAMEEISDAIRNKIPACQLKKRKALTKIQQEWLAERLKRADFSERMRLHYYLGIVLEDENEIQESFQEIKREVLKTAIPAVTYRDHIKIAKDVHTVKLPLRVNWGGGWSDTPPYCNENSGTVLNAAILLNGEKPVEVTLKKIKEAKIVFDSRDMDVHGEFDSIEPLQKTGNPFDPFALQKACLLVCGIIPKEGCCKLSDILKRLGGGFVIRSEVTNVPKGSGLGTSSILGAATVKAVFEFFGIEYTEDKLYSCVLAMEQIMSTGGGWQDQVGGATPGVKYIVSMPAKKHEIKVVHVEIPFEARKELDERLVLIYTGQRRLARNLLRDVIGRYLGNEPDSLYALEEIQKVAALMRFELERGNIDGFAGLLNTHWELSRKIDAGSSNTLIEQIFSSIDDTIAGKLVCGAGGGGFLQVILKKGYTKKEVEERLMQMFGDSMVSVADCKILWE